MQLTPAVAKRIMERISTRGGIPHPDSTMNHFTTSLIDAVYLLAFINPVSKISVLAVMSSPEERGQFFGVVTRSSIVGFSILLFSVLFGDFILRAVFHVDMQSLQVAGGAVLAWAGFNALRKGVFFEMGTQERFADLAIVPLACPMIAGPATIAASMTLAGHKGTLLPAVSILIAVGVNYLLMLSSRSIGRVLIRFNILGALIRITGLVVMTIGVQMIHDGLASWLK